MSGAADHHVEAALRHDAIVLAGGRARRLGGADKPGLMVGDTTLLDRVIAAGAAADSVIVVGAERATAREVRWARESPPGGGPVAALAAGLPLVAADLVVVLAADLPFLDPTTVAALVAAATADSDGALLVDGQGRDQLLAGAWSTSALRAALADLGEPAGASFRALVGGLRYTRVPAPAGVPWLDVNCQDDLQRARERS